MTSSVFTRIEKLESRHRNDGQVLLLWIKPGEDIDAAVLSANKAGLFASSDLVMCAEWLGDDPMPKPRWLKREGERFSEQEDHCISTMLEKRIATVEALIAKGEPAEVPGLARRVPRDLSEISSVDLMHCALGIKT
jgi:hypothetical protein